MITTETTAFPRPWNAVVSSIEWAEVISSRKPHDCSRQKPSPFSHQQTETLNSRQLRPLLPIAIIDCNCGQTGRKLQTFVKTTLRSIPHSRAGVNRLAEFLGELVPSCRRITQRHVNGDRGRLRLRHVPRLLILPIRHRRHLIAFLALAASFLTHTQRSKAKILSPLIDRLIDLPDGGDIDSRHDDDSNDDESHGDVSASRRWALFVLDVNPFKFDASSLAALPLSSCATSSTGTASFASSIFFRRKQQRNRIEALSKQFARKKGADNEENLAKHPSPMSALNASRVDERLQQSLLTVGTTEAANSSVMDYDVADDRVAADQRVSHAAELFRNWLEDQSKDDGGGGTTTTNPNLQDMSVVSVPSTQLSARASCSQGVAADPFVNLNGAELIRVLKLGFGGNDPMHSSDEENILSFETLGPFLDTIVVWHRGAKGGEEEQPDARSDVENDLRLNGASTCGVFEYVASRILVPQFMKLSSTPSRAVFGSVGELIRLNSSLAVSALLLPFVDRLQEAKSESSVRISFPRSLLGQLVRLHLPDYCADSLLSFTMAKWKDGIHGTSITSVIVESILDKSSPLSSSLRPLVVRFTTDLRSLPRDKSLVLVLSKFLVLLKRELKAAIGKGLLFKEDLEELNSAVQLNRTPLKRGVATALKAILNDVD